MRRLLITTTWQYRDRFRGTWNIGDNFARIGTEKAIRSIDAEAEIDLLDMHDHDDIMRPRGFDKCVLAGRPLFWRDCESYPEWTHIIHGWPGESSRKNMMALGVGDCYALPRDTRHLLARITEAKQKMFAITTRFTVANNPARSMVCPAAFCLMRSRGSPYRKLCNFMPGGTHYPEFSNEEHEKWQSVLRWLNPLCLEAGFEHVAHNDAERELAIKLGWPEDRIIFHHSTEEYLNDYAEATHYLGNRMHGAVVLAHTRAKIMAVGFDSRLDMVKRSGSMAITPSQASLQTIQEFLSAPPSDEPVAQRQHMVERDFGLAQRLLMAFARK